MIRRMWFGPRGAETWIMMPRIDMDSAHTHVGARADQIRGGVSVRDSGAGHQEYGMSWNPARRDDIALIQDIADGMYDTQASDGLIHFIDPAAADKNLLPRLWAAPMLCALGAPSLTKGVKPALVATPTNTRRLPANSATFTTTASTPMLSLYLPIPPGHTARFGFYGPTAQADKIRYRPVGGTTVGAASTIGIQANTAYGTGLTSLTAGPAVTGILLDLNPVAGSATITAGLLRLDEGSPAVAPTTFISGRGHSGCKIEPGSLASVVHNVYYDRVSTTVRLLEVGSWL